MQSRVDVLTERLPKTTEGLWGAAYALATLAHGREGFEISEKEAEAIVFFWWAGSCNEDPGLATCALTFAEDDAEDLLRVDPADPFRRRLRETVGLLAGVARGKGYARTAPEE